MAAWLFLHWGVAHVPDMPGRQHWRPQMVTHTHGPTRCPAEHVLQRLLRDDLWHHVTIVLLPFWRQLLDLRCMQL